MASVADHLITRLRDAGVRALFGVPGGGGNLDLIAAAGRGGIPFVLTSTETGAAIAAIAQAEITGKPGACLTTLGPGAASVVNGVACAYLDRAPIVVFTDNYSPADQERYTHQRLEHAALFKSITNYSGSLSPDAVMDTVDRAFETLRTQPTGPVHVDCPADFASGSWRGEGGALISVVDSATVVASGVGPVESIEDLLRSARKPLAIVGLGARRPEHAEAIRALCERLNLPAMVTYKAKGVVPDAHPWFAGVFTNGAIEKALFTESDLIIGIGLDMVELLPRPWTAEKFILFGPESGASADGIRQVDEALQRTEWDAAHVRADVEAQRRRVAIPASGLSAQRVVEVAAAKLARDCRVTVDAGAHMFLATMLWPVSEPNQMLISNGLSTMGFALPAAIGAALLDRKQPVVALTGDGGLLMCLGELMTAVRERLRIIVMVFSDASLSLIEIKQQARKLAPAGVALGQIDWPAIARGFGATGFVAGDEAGLDRAIDAALAAAGPSLIEAKIDRSNYGATLKAVRG
jgi:acetolactate synthase I/II/III large subunit